jgi:hypothetical protein
LDGQDYRLLLLTILLSLVAVVVLVEIQHFKEAVVVLVVFKQEQHL